VNRGGDCQAFSIDLLAEGRRQWPSASLEDDEESDDGDDESDGDDDESDDDNSDDESFQGEKEKVAA